CDARGRLGFEDRPYPQRERLRRALGLALAVDTASVAAQAAERGLEGPAIGAAIRAARIRAIAEGFGEAA
ncbi:MAG TPA: multifunctional CCA tRNA nucleotidyl transferase/2'3'-cyclic phosphodiesterase/2'nucleotidase/phosphatase, partial [Albitalea sp.]|nr:multifunctional CCA tRNA nucleotidyl transferase/2'3'-cyclic phosphodiesterase/2'nucleotidase/phosphatase [Albitalea sp.]